MNKESVSTTEEIVALVDKRLASEEGKQLVAAAKRELEKYRVDLEKRILIDPGSILDRITL
jgi:hypothetical protein